MNVERVRSAVESPLSSAGFVIEDVTISRAGRRSVVRIAVDRDHESLGGQDATSIIAPLSLDDVADATRVVSDVLDADESLSSAPYVLEVSSPGVDRPLTHWRHFRRNVGRLVGVETVNGATFTGRLLSSTADELVLAGAPGPLAMTEVRRGRVEIEFSRLDELAEIEDPDDMDDMDDMDDPDVDVDDEEED
ncbi:MAG: ribosome maturation factor RimP [Candidatus Phosphoribacter sp.]|nr:ribosome maturation factor RimP [Actinomycetales bacterium]